MLLLKNFIGNFRSAHENVPLFSALTSTLASSDSWFFTHGVVKSSILFNNPLPVHAGAPQGASMREKKTQIKGR